MAKKTTRKKSGSRRVAAAADLPELPASLRVPPAKPMSSLLGQDAAVSVLESSLNSGRLHHAWIFHGPSGVGKFTAAVSFASLLLDPDAGPGLAGGFDADPESPVQQLIRAGTHPDLHVIRKELARYSDDKRVRDSKLTTIPIDVIETHLLRPAKLAPAQGSGGLASKVFIVDEAELLDRSPTNAPVQNALLKTLEEPPEGTVIILVTSSVDRLLPTIRSRCQRVSFVPLGPDDLGKWWNQEASSLPRVVEQAEAQWLLTTSDGAPGTVMASIESGMYDWWRQLEPMLQDAMRGREHPDLGGLMSELVDQWAGEWVKEGEKIGEHRSKEAANRLGAQRMLGLVGQFARQQLTSRESEIEWAISAIELVGSTQELIRSQVQAGFAMARLAGRLASKPIPV